MFKRSMFFSATEENSRLSGRVGGGEVGVGVGWEQAYKKKAFEKEVISPTLCVSHPMTKPVLMTELLCADMCGGSFYNTRLHCTERLCPKGPRQLWALRSTETNSLANSKPCQRT